MSIDVDFIELARIRFSLNLPERFLSVSINCHLPPTSDALFHHRISAKDSQISLYQPHLLSSNKVSRAVFNFPRSLYVTASRTTRPKLSNTLVRGIRCWEQPSCTLVADKRLELPATDSQVKAVHTIAFYPLKTDILRPHLRELGILLLLHARFRAGLDVKNL